MNVCRVGAMACVAVGVGVGAMVSHAAGPAGAQGAGTAPARIFFDSDMDNDCDDVAAMAVLHALADRNEAVILATVTSGLNESSPLCMDAINTYFRRPGIPVGAARSGPNRPSLYAKVVAERCPHALKSAADAPGAVELYRKILAEQPDGSVTVVTVGFHTNLAELLKAPAEKDRLSGEDLVRKKVRLWACMGGNFIGKPAKDDLALGNVNFQKNAPATLYAINHWPTPITFVGREVASVPSGVKIGAAFKDLPETHPVRIAYEAYFKGPCKDRHVADPATVLFAVRGAGDCWDIEDRGYMDLKADMTFQWRYDADRHQSYLLKRMVDGKPNDHHVEQTLQDLILGSKGGAATQAR